METTTIQFLKIFEYAPPQSDMLLQWTKVENWTNPLTIVKFYSKTTISYILLQLMPHTIMDLLNDQTKHLGTWFIACFMPWTYPQSYCLHQNYATPWNDQMWHLISHAQVLIRLQKIYEFLIATWMFIFLAIKLTMANHDTVEHS